VTDHEAASFSAGQDSGTRLSACLARMAAIQLVEEARWWNRWRRRLMARALVACADELEEQADATRAEWKADAAGVSGVRPSLGHLAAVAPREPLGRVAR